MRRLGLWSLLTLLLIGLALPASAAPRVELSVQAANEGRVKQNGWVTVLVELANQGGEIAGELVVESDTDAPHTQYVVPYTLPAGGRKRIPVSLPDQGTWPVAVKLYAEGKLLGEKSLNLTWLSPESLLVGVLSGDELGIPGLSQLQAGQGTAQVVRLTAATLADSATLLADFDVIALSRFDSSGLTADQLRALEVWVGRGGTLLLAGGPEWRRTLGPLPASLVPVEVTGVRELSLAPLGDLAGKPLAATGAVSVGRLTRGQELLATEGVPLVATAPTGMGRVVYIAFDPGLNPVVSWEGQAALFNRLLGSAAATPGWRTDPDWQMQDALRRLPEWGLPGVWTVALLLVGYLLLVGPANYLVLKRVDRREWGWFTVPALSVLFVGAVYLMGFGRLQPLVSHLITITEIAPGGQSGTVTTHLGLYAPSKERLSVAVPEARLIKPFIQGPGAGNRVMARVVAGEQTRVELLGLNNFSMGGFRMEREAALAGGLDLVEARLVDGNLTGRIRNGLEQPVDGVEVEMASGQSVVAIGRLEPGQTSEPFTLAIALNQPANPKGIPFVNGLPPSGNDPAAMRRFHVRSYLREAMAARGGFGLVVSGWTDRPIVEQELPDLGSLIQGANLVYSVSSLPADGESVEIPAGMILGRPEDAKAVSWSPMGYSLPPGSSPFTLVLPPLNMAKVGGVELDLQQPLPPGVSGVSVRNQRTGEWQLVAAQQMRLEPWQDFLSATGLIELRYEATHPVDIPAPTVAVKGGSR